MFLTRTAPLVLACGFTALLALSGVQPNSLCSNSGCPWSRQNCATRQHNRGIRRILKLLSL